MTFKPVPRLDRWLALLVILAVLGLDALAARAVMGRPVDGGSFLLALWVLGSLLIVIYLAYSTFCAFTLEYWVDRDGVTLVWGFTSQFVPMAEIQRVQRGDAAVRLERVRPWHWPYVERRRCWGVQAGVINAYATRPLSEQMILATADEAYGLSPAEPDRFLAALQARHALGPVRSRRTELRYPPLWTWPLWRDRSALFLIGAGLLGVLLIFGMLCFRYPVLSADLPLHFDVNGVPDSIAPKSGLFALPIIGLLTWTMNLALGVWLYRRVQPQGAYLLWGGALAVQGIAGLALFNLMRW